MPRKRPPQRIDQIADAATEVFIQQGYGPAKIAHIARVARVGPGTIYLYAQGKEALFDLAVRRALEDASVWTLKFPHPNPGPGELADALWRCLQHAAHFPQLWLAADSPAPKQVEPEVTGIVTELYRWLFRYRRAIKLVERCGGDWPDVSQVFYRRFWRGGVRRLADYFERRIREKALPPRPDALAAAHLVVESLTWMAVHRPWTADAAPLSDGVIEDTAVSMVSAAITTDTR